MNTDVNHAYQSIAPQVLLAAVRNDMPSFSRLLATFLRIAPPMLEQLRQAVSALDFKAVQLHSHSLKGASMLIGAAELVRLLQEIESQAGDAGHAPAALFLQQVQQEFEKVCAEVQCCLRESA